MRTCTHLHTHLPGSFPRWLFLRLLSEFFYRSMLPVSQTHPQGRDWREERARVKAKWCLSREPAVLPGAQQMGWRADIVM